MSSNLTIKQVSDLIDISLPQFTIFLITFVLPVFAFLGAASNVVILFIMPLRDVAISKTAKIYYLAIAVGDFFSIFTFNILWVFLDESLGYLFGEQRSIDLSDETTGCKIIWNLWTNAESLSNYGALAMTVEKIIALYLPLKSRSLLTNKFSTILIIAHVLPVWMILTPLNVIVNDVIIAPGIGQGGQSCGKDVDHDWFLVSTYAQVLLSWCFPEILHFLGAILISYKLFTIQTARKALFHNLGNVQSELSSNAREINSTVIILLVVFSRFVIYFPVAVSTFYYYVFQLDGYLSYVEWNKAHLLNLERIRYVVAIGGITRIFLELTSITHSINLLIYYYRIPSFRRKFLSFFTCGLHSHSPEDFFIQGA